VTILFGLFLWQNVLIPLEVRTRVEVIGWERTHSDGSVGVATLHADTSLSYAFDTALVLLLWAWCGAKLLMRGEPAEKSACPELPTGGAAPLK
jgi:hypothetical protein